jgi:hypothetical protein
LIALIVLLALPLVAAENMLQQQSGRYTRHVALTMAGCFYALIALVVLFNVFGGSLF